MTDSLVSYRSVVSDNARWEGFAFREGDIVISTPPKCGTTWTQMICALLIFQTPDLPEPLDQLSPWLEQQTESLASVRARLEAQTHRRFIKSHTPMDGIPFDERVTYIFVGRDPRDVAVSWDNHMSNMDLVAFLKLREEAVGNEDLAELLEARVEPAQDPVERFWQWAYMDDAVGGLTRMLQHLGSFYENRELPNVIGLHYGEMKADLAGQMRRLARELSIEVPEERWPELVEAATFESMKERAEKVAPNSTETIWKDTSNFFNKGTNEQWRQLIDEAGLQRYAERVAELCSPELSAWVHQGPI